MYYLYIFELKNGDLYVGSTGDLKRRAKEHSDNKVISTRNKIKKLIHYEAYVLKSDCLRREKYLKTTEGKRFLGQQIRDLLSKIRT